jgi:hypothetical protein
LALDAPFAAAAVVHEAVLGVKDIVAMPANNDHLVADLGLAMHASV